MKLKEAIDRLIQLEDYYGAHEKEALHLIINQCRRNVCIGFKAGLMITTGEGNVCIGRAAGKNITTGSYNICIGDNTDVEDGTKDNQLIVKWPPT